MLCNQSANANEMLRSEGKNCAAEDLEALVHPSMRFKDVDPQGPISRYIF